MRLFRSEDGFNVEIEPELFLLAPFRALYDDRKCNDALVLKELAYIYFKNELTSDFQHITDQNERGDEVSGYLNLPPLWIPDSYIRDCEEFYIKHSETASGKLIKTGYMMVDKIKQEVEAIDMSERDKSGKPIYTVKMMLDSTKEIYTAVDKLQTAEKTFMLNQKESSLKKGSKTKSDYEDFD